MDIIVPVMASAGFVALVQLLIKIAENTHIFRHWRAKREATVADELYREFKNRNEKLDTANKELHKENLSLSATIDEWQDKYYRLFVKNVEQQDHKDNQKNEY